MKSHRIVYLAWIICLSFMPAFVYAEGITSVFWSNTSETSGCQSETSSDGRTRYGVPIYRYDGAAEYGGDTCETHFYGNQALYTNGSYADYPLLVDIGDSYGNGAITVCNSGDEVLPSQTVDNEDGTLTIYCRHYDDTPPSTNDFTYAINNNLLANTAYPINGGVNAGGGSPIKSISFQLKKSDGTISIGNAFSRGDNSSSANGTMDISNVDLDRRSNGGRPYILSATAIDDAGNTTTKDFYFNAYANKPYSFTSLNTSAISASNIADGTQKNIAILAQDQYGNKIVPASGITRTVKIDLTADNQLHLNQMNSNGGSAVDVVDTSNTAYNFPFTNFVSLSNQVPQSNDTYFVGFKVYTPTKIGYSEGDVGKVSNMNESFTLTNVGISTADTIGGNGAIEDDGWTYFKYKPLYHTTFAGDLSEWFIEGSYQNSSISSHHNGSINGSNPILTLAYLDSSNSFNLDLNSTTLSSSSPTKNFSLGDYSIETFLKQQSSSVVDRTSGVSLSSHISYTLDDKDITYNSDVIGKASYTEALTNVGNQTGLKVVGMNYTKTQTALLTNQIPTDVTIMDANLDKNTIRTQIKKSIYELIRGMQDSNETDAVVTKNSFETTNSNGWSLLDLGNNSSVLYFNNISPKIGGTMYNSSSFDVSGKRTLVSIGQDIYIHQNIVNSNTNTNAMAIVALKDVNGNGGNIYIDTQVTNIHAVLFAEKSLLSSTGGVGLTSTSNTANILKNQLYIYGGAVSNNTIGGGKTGTCPDGITNCTTEVAQFYDLNYLRRYHLISSEDGYDTPYMGGLTLNNTTCNPLGQCGAAYIHNNRNYTDTTSEFAKNSVIIDYNEHIKSIAPPWF